jgi:hypothetical protein
MHSSQPYIVVLASRELGFPSRYIRSPSLVPEENKTGLSLIGEDDILCGRRVFLCACGEEGARMDPAALIYPCDGSIPGPGAVRLRQDNAI